MSETRGSRRRRSTALLVGGGLASLILGLTFLAPWLAPYDPGEQIDLAMSRRQPPATRLHLVELDNGIRRLASAVERTPEGLVMERQGRTVALAADEVTNLTAEGVADQRFYLLGTDGLGRDLLSRMLHGGRVSLLVGLLSVILALSLGILVGSLAALGGSFVDAVLMRGVDALLSFPVLFLLLALSGLFHPSTALIVVILGGTAWMGVSRLVRGELISLRDRDFVLAARASGLPLRAILWRHLLPNAWAPVMVQATLLFVDVVLAEASLSFLRMGVPPPTPTWGNMVADGRPDLATAWWISAFPGIAIALTVVAFNLLADGLRDELDPRQD